MEDDVNLGKKLEQAGKSGKYIVTDHVQYYTCMKRRNTWSVLRAKAVWQ